VSNTTFTTRVSGKMSSRGWAIALGIGAVVLAAILLVVYLDRYRARVSGRNAPTPVLVAKQTIRQGTPGAVIANNGMYVPSTLPRKDVVVGAIADPQYLSGRAAVADIFPGHQLLATDFAVDTGASISSQLTGDQRALSINIDTTHGSLSQVRAGDNVDVYISAAGVVKLFRPDVKVLAIPATQGPSGAGNLIVRVKQKDAADWAFAADNAQFWFVLRPVVGAKKTAKDTANAASILR